MAGRATHARFARIALVASSTLLAAACAGSREPQRTFTSPQAARGAEIAELRCAGCHSIDSYTVSPRSTAPPFRTLRIRFNQLSWERAMREIAIGGHDEMPALSLPDTDARALHAYILTVR